MQIPIFNGIFADTDPNFRTSYPRNLVPVPKMTGISQGYLRPSEGIAALGTGSGVGRGAINWNNSLYRVMGTKLIYISKNNVVTEVGDVGGSGRVTFDYGFDYLAIASGNKLFLYDGTTLTQITDADLGVVKDVVWVDGYFMTTDGEFLIVTELNDPFAVNPLKYGSSEANPDPVVGLLKVRNEVYALNRHTIEVFDNVGGTGFPFRRIDGAQIQKGCVGTHAACIFMDSVAFIGGGFNEAPAIWVAANGNAQKISTREIDQVLAKYTEEELATAFLEERRHDGHIHLIVHLPQHTFVFDGAATSVLAMPIWFSLSSTLIGEGAWSASDCIWAYDRWNVSHTETNQFGYLTTEVSTHWGETIGWQFGTIIIYEKGNNVIFHRLELVNLSGSIAFGDDATIWTQYSTDGVTWSEEKPIVVGKTGERNKRLAWFQQGHMKNMRMQRFRGTSDAHIAIAALEAHLQPLVL